MTPTEARNARLTALKNATTQWADNQTKYLNDQVTFAKRILRGRTGSERLTSTALSLGKDIVVDEINTFLTG
jgi:hypothetical protein